jgi:hypothetical protein
LDILLDASAARERAIVAAEVASVNPNKPKPADKTPLIQDAPRPVNVQRSLPHRRLARSLHAREIRDRILGKLSAVIKRNDYNLLMPGDLRALAQTQSTAAPILSAYLQLTPDQRATGADSGLDRFGKPGAARAWNRQTDNESDPAPWHVPHGRIMA